MSTKLFRYRVSLRAFRRKVLKHLEREACKLGNTTREGLKGRYVFEADQEGKPYTRWNNNPWRMARDKSGLKGLKWHDLRRTFASRLYMAGVGIRLIKKLMGHSSEAMTWSYIEGDPEDLRTAYPHLNFDGVESVNKLDRYQNYTELLFPTPKALELIPGGAAHEEVTAHLTAHFAFSAH